MSSRVPAQLIVSVFGEGDLAHQHRQVALTDRLHRGFQARRPATPRRAHPPAQQPRRSRATTRQNDGSRGWAETSRAGALHL